MAIAEITLIEITFALLCSFGPRDKTARKLKTISRPKKIQDKTKFAVLT
jgi:hypothetical protein